MRNTWTVIEGRCSARAEANVQYRPNLTRPEFPVEWQCSHSRNSIFELPPSNHLCQVFNYALPETLYVQELLTTTQPTTRTSNLYPHPQFPHLWHPHNLNPTTLSLTQAKLPAQIQTTHPMRPLASLQLPKRHLSGQLTP